MSSQGDNLEKNSANDQNKQQKVIVAETENMVANIQLDEQKTQTNNSIVQEKQKLKQPQESKKQQVGEETKVIKSNLQEEVEKVSVEKKKVIENEQEPMELYQTKYFVEINRSSIPFGKNTLFPGSIEEIDVVIGLKDEIIEDNNNNNPFMLRVIAKCSNAEFNDLDEYVFSVRSNERYEYFEEVRFKIRKKQRAQVKIAVKVPPVKENYTIQGILQIQLESLQPVCMPICAKCQVPQISCSKDLYKPDEETQIIKVPAKKNQIRMPPIPFKNLSNFNFTLQVEAITHENFSNKPYDIITQNFVNCQANAQFLVNLQLKENMAYKGPMPSKDTIRKILILKIKGSSKYLCSKAVQQIPSVDNLYLKS